MVWFSPLHSTAHTDAGLSAKELSVHYEAGMRKLVGMPVDRFWVVYEAKKGVNSCGEGVRGGYGEFSP